MYILLGLLVLVVLLLIVIATRPKTFTVTRSLAIRAAPAVVFAQVEDFRRWGAWSPWEKIDPDSKKTYSGAAAGVGAVYRWQGNMQVGEGMMTITGLRPAESIAIDIDIEFFKPFKAKNLVTFTFVAQGDTTSVTWSMSGTNSFMGKAMSLVMSSETMIGGPFAQGLAQLKTVCETA